MPYRQAARPKRAILRVEGEDHTLLGELEIDERAIVAAGACLLDLEDRLDACVLDVGYGQALVVAQEPSWLVLYGRALATALRQSSWNERWHRLRADHARHLARGVAPDTAWPPRWGHAVVRGYVEPCAELSLLADLVRERSQQVGGALLTVPKLRIDANGAIHAFGVVIDTRRRFDIRYVWAMGKRNARGDADAIILEQAGRAVCVSMSARPGGFPSIGALPAAAPELVTPELPLDELVTPAAFAALDGWLDARMPKS